MKTLNENHKGNSSKYPIFTEPIKHNQHCFITAIIKFQFQTHSLINLIKSCKSNNSNTESKPQAVKIYYYSKICSQLVNKISV